MKYIRKLIVIIAVLALALNLSACHKKDEIAVTVGDVEFTSAYYMCAIINADAEAKEMVLADLTDEELSGSQDIDYYSKKVEDKSFTEWVEDRAIEILTNNAAYRAMCAEKEIELDEEATTEAESYASFYWSNYGYSKYFEPNGVSQATYTQYFKDVYLSEYYFEKIYGAEGEKAISEEDVKTAIYDNFVVANYIDASYTSDMSDDDKKDLIIKLDSYLRSLQIKTKTFEEIYEEYNEIEDTESNTSNEQTEDSEIEDYTSPKDKYATIFGVEGTGYESEYYETVKNIPVGNVQLVTLDNDAGYLLVEKLDISADPYYLTSLDMAARHLIADEEFNKTISDFADKLEVDINSFATKQFNVKNIIVPENTTY